MTKTEWRVAEWPDCPPDYLGGYWPIGQSMQIYQNTVEMNWSSTQPTGFGIYFL